jgi:hypothetical protein
MKVIPGGNGQMSLIRDTEEVAKFLEFAGRKNILNERAVNHRLTACNNVFSVLNEDEDNLDYILGNLDVLIHRLRNKNPNVRASTLKVYKSRVKSSLEDFKAWSADPFAWEREVIVRAKAQGLEGRKEKQAAKRAKRSAALAAEATTAAEPAEKPAVRESAPSALPSEGLRVRLPIRPDFSIDIVLPKDGLKLKELHRLGMFLYPYCVDVEVTGPWPGLST